MGYRQYRVTCPSDPSHKRFSTSAHVMEEWEVDEYGEYVKTIESLQVDHGPDPDNLWTCLECGADAAVDYAPVEYAKTR